MEETQGPTPSSEPLLHPPSPAESPRADRLSVLLGHAAGRRSRSMAVRETAARQLRERRADWAYSRPVVALDIVWNLAFAVASAVVLSVTVRERPNVPIRLWVAGYAIQCGVHVVLVWVEYRRRIFGRRTVEDDERAGSDSDDNDSEEEVGRVEERRVQQGSAIIKRCESLNTMVSFIWWIVGFYWLVSGGETLMQNAPKLYWLAVIFLAFDVFFAVFCLALACVIGIALCCCLPCIIAILYALAGQEGASDADISILPRYRFAEASSDEQKTVTDGEIMIPAGNNRDESVHQRILLREDAECCICLAPYEDGMEIHSLPCNHHFHSACIIKWLRINATCPLCKYNILKGSERV